MQIFLNPHVPLLQYSVTLVPIYLFYVVVLMQGIPHYNVSYLVIQLCMKLFFQEFHLNFISALWNLSLGIIASITFFILFFFKVFIVVILIFTILLMFSVLIFLIFPCFFSAFSPKLLKPLQTKNQLLSQKDQQLNSLKTQYKFVEVN